MRLMAVSVGVGVADSVKGERECKCEWAECLSRDSFDARLSHTDPSNFESLFYFA